MTVVLDRPQADQIPAQPALGSTTDTADEVWRQHEADKAKEAEDAEREGLAASWAYLADDNEPQTKPATHGLFNRFRRATYIARTRRRASLNDKTAPVQTIKPTKGTEAQIFEGRITCSVDWNRYQFSPRSLAEFDRQVEAMSTSRRAWFRQHFCYARVFKDDNGHAPSRRRKRINGKARTRRPSR